MTSRGAPYWNRRELLHGLVATGAVGLLGLYSSSVKAEPPPETATVRVVFDPEAAAICFAPKYVAEQFLRLEGFSDVQYVPFVAGGAEAETVAEGKADFAATIGTGWIAAVDAGAPVVVVTGLHVGCIELFTRERLRSIRDLAGRRIGVYKIGTVNWHFLASLVAYVGLDPMKDIKWVPTNPSDWVRLLDEGQLDAISTFPPMGYELHERKIGHVLLNTTTEAPWRHYFCCMVGASRKFVESYPVATKRVVRAILKANDLCSLQPERTARWLVDRKFVTDYDYTVQTLRDVPYGAWRTYDPDDTLRFYSLRLREAGLIEHTPQEIIDLGANWRFLDEVKKELKA